MTNFPRQSDVDRVSIQTPVGRGAVAVIAVAGPGAVAAVGADFRAASRRPLGSQPIGRICFGQFAGEEVVVCRVGPSALEIHCHGGQYAPRRIVERLTAGGCQVEPWQTWFDLEGQTTIASEALRALAVTRTAATAAILLDQYNGALAEGVQQAAGLLAAGDWLPGRGEIELLRSRYSVGRRLTESFRVVIAGLPNVGKSSLINALLGYRRAIVADLAGTTRDVVAAEAAIAGWPIQLIDAAGLRTTIDPLEAAGVELAGEQLARADVVLWVVDATELPAASVEAADRHAREQQRGWSLGAETPVLTVINKIDRRLDDEWPATERVVSVSALEGLGVDCLADRLASLVVAEDVPAGTAVPFTARHDGLLAEAQAALARQDVALAIDALNRLG